MTRTVPPLALLAVLAVLACRGPETHGPTAAPVPDPKAASTSLDPRTPLTPAARRWVDSTLASMTIRELAGQLMAAWVPGAYLSADSDEFDRALELVEGGVGAIWVMGGLPYERAATTNALQARARVPLLVLSGTQGMGQQLLAPPLAPETRYLGGGTDIPPAMALAATGDSELTRAVAGVVAREYRATGSHAVGGPDANVLRDLDNVLHNRTFGDDPELVAQHVRAFVEGADAEGLATSPGFFPGAGSMREDPHVVLPVSTATAQEFRDELWTPFRAAAEAGAPVVVSSHFAAPALTGDSLLPATLSQDVTRLLREEIGFQGVLGTDAFDMGALTGNYPHMTAVLKAFEAGNDLFLGAYSLPAADTLASRVASGVHPEASLLASARRILELKARLGLHEGAQVDLAVIRDVVGTRDHQRLADSVAERSLVLLRDDGGRIPLSPDPSATVLSITYEAERNRTAGQAFDGALRRAFGRVESFRVTPDADDATLQEIATGAADAEIVVVSVYLRPPLGLMADDQPGLSPPFIQFVNRLQASGIEPVVVSFGELELLDALPELGTLLMAWSEQRVMQRAAVRGLTGETPITGTLPLDLPPHHRRGHGLRR